ncbi:MAG: hypothetical protein F6K10_25990 [Moorea sp. SIO2B7]|nr:hypothetical protein [Moorena sp. SIO2B7]
MYKILPIALTATTLVFIPNELPKSVLAGTCTAASSCGKQPLQFVPGEIITVEVVNRTASVIELQQLYATDPLTIIPGQTRSFLRGGSTDPNFSVVLWDVMGASLKVDLLKTAPRRLRIEVRPGGQITGDRTIYLRNDGRFDIF